MGKRKAKNSDAKGASPAAVVPTFTLPPNLLAAATKHHTFGQIKTLAPGAVWVQSAFLSAKECQALIDWSAPQWEYTAHQSTKYIAHRECFRIQRNDDNVAKALFARLQASGLLNLVQKALTLRSNYQPMACNPNIRLYQYAKGMRFGKHVDGSDDTAVGQTEITLLVYLSNCQGGATRFWQPHSSDEFAFVPEQGAILLHVHGDRCLEHAADSVTAGTKYVLRSDVCYRYV